MSNLNGWHRGERLIRHKLGYDKIPSTAYLYTSISGELPYEHSKFYSTRLQFLPVCTLDEEGRPWSSLLVGEGAERGFVRNTKYNTLRVQAKLGLGDPFWRTASTFKPGREMLVAGIGVETTTRRRNKFAGSIKNLSFLENSTDIELEVNEAIGNCPKYITTRTLEPVSPTPNLLYDNPQLGASDRLPTQAISLIQSSDIVFLGTTYVAHELDRRAFPSHLGMNHRGGRRGFIRVKPSDGRTVVLPDFSGNRFMTSLGNVEATPLASLTFVSFTTGDILYLTGSARNLYGEEARAVMPFQETLTEIYVTGYTFVQNAFPLRENPTEGAKESPYNPPLRLLAEEDSSARIFAATEQPKVLLTRIMMHTPTIATFDWEVEAPKGAHASDNNSQEGAEKDDGVEIQPGQSAILDFTPIFGKIAYAHMSPHRPNLVNEDFVRTWTVSSIRSSASSSPSATSTALSSTKTPANWTRRTQTFSLTMREKPGGTVTGALFSLARKLKATKSEKLDDCRDLSLRVSLVGVSGEFVLPSNFISRPVATPNDGRKMLWIAGGIGITPFMAMLEALSAESKHDVSVRPDITLLVSTREPDVMLGLVSNVISTRNVPFKLHIVSTNKSASTSPKADELASHGIELTRHSRRIDTALLGSLYPHSTSGGSEVTIGAAADVDVYICGPNDFADSIKEMLGSDALGSGVAVGRIVHEGFAY